MPQISDGFLLSMGNLPISTNETDAQYLNKEKQSNDARRLLKLIVPSMYQGLHLMAKHALDIYQWHAKEWRNDIKKNAKNNIN